MMEEAVPAAVGEEDFEGDLHFEYGVDLDSSRRTRHPSQDLEYSEPYEPTPAAHLYVENSSPVSLDNDGSSLGHEEDQDWEEARPGQVQAELDDEELGLEPSTKHAHIDGGSVTIPTAVKAQPAPLGQFPTRHQDQSRVTAPPNAHSSALPWESALGNSVPRKRIVAEEFGSPASVDSLIDPQGGPVFSPPRGTAEWDTPPRRQRSTSTWSEEASPFHGNLMISPPAPDDSDPKDLPTPLESPLVPSIEAGIAAAEEKGTGKSTPRRPEHDDGWKSLTRSVVSSVLNDDEDGDANGQIDNSETQGSMRRPRIRSENDASLMREGSAGSVGSPESEGLHPLPSWHFNRRIAESARTRGDADTLSVGSIATAPPLYTRKYQQMRHSNRPSPTPSAPGAPPSTRRPSISETKSIDHPRNHWQNRITASLSELSAGSGSLGSSAKSIDEHITEHLRNVIQSRSRALSSGQEPIVIDVRVSEQLANPAIAPGSQPSLYSSSTNPEPPQQVYTSQTMSISAATTSAALQPPSSYPVPHRPATMAANGISPPLPHASTSMMRPPSATSPPTAYAASSQQPVQARPRFLPTATEFIPQQFPRPLPPGTYPPLPDEPPPSTPPVPGSRPGQAEQSSSVSSYYTRPVPTATSAYAAPPSYPYNSYHWPQGHPGAPHFPLHDPNRPLPYGLLYGRISGMAPVTKPPSGPSRFIAPRSSSSEEMEPSVESSQ